VLNFNTIDVDKMTLPKDYYKIMDVKPSATTTEIKRSYRRLAMKYHPDRNHGDGIAEATFRAIAEAYAILSNPDTRKQYDTISYQAYKQKPATEVTRASIQLEIHKLQQIVAGADPFRTNQDALYFQLLQILSDTNIAILQKETSVAGTRLLVEQLLQCSKPFNFAFAQKVSVPLLQLADNDATATNAINAFVQAAYRTSQWNRYKPIVAIIAAVILCVLIFLMSR
jgi:molecular chaperone DnaJ